MLRSDQASYHHMKDAVLERFSGGYVDAFIRTGDLDFEKMAKRIDKRFEMAEDQTIPCVFTGFSILQGKTVKSYSTSTSISTGWRGFLWMHRIPCSDRCGRN